MKLCDLTLPTPEENLACDEALLEQCEASDSQEVLRFWEPVQYFVVVGYSNRIATEVNLPFCQRNTLPVLRRCTGGGTVLQGPGCLNYSLILRIANAKPLESISGTNRYILDRNRAALSALVRARVDQEGHTDMAIGGLKFAGNAQRRKQRYLLFHGSILVHCDFELMEKVLPLPSWQPDYRVGRSHSDFLMNLKVPSHLLKTALLESWNAAEPLSAVPFERIGSLVREKYGQAEWNFKF
jgi:lipoate---protein ligase